MKGFSIIVCCYNSEKLLPATLSMLAVLKISPLFPVELIVIDNASTDATASIAKNIWQQLGQPFPLKSIAETKPGLSYARLAGISAAQFENLVFCDDDNRLHENYLTEAIKIFETNNSIGALGGIGTGISDIEIPSWSNAFQLFGCGAQAMQTGEARVLYGAGVIIKKPVFEKLLAAGFCFHLTDRKKEKLSSGGDYELCYAIKMCGYKAWYNSEMKFEHYIHPARLTFSYYKKYIHDTSISNNVLSIYTALLSSPKITYTKFTFQQIKQLLSHLKADFIFSFKYFFLRLSGKQYLQIYFALYYHLLRTRQVLVYIFTSKKDFTSIKTLAENIEKI